MRGSGLEFSMNSIKMAKAVIFSFVVFLSSLSLSGQSQNMRFSEIVWRATNTHAQNVTYTVPQGHVYKMTSFSVNQENGRGGKLKVNGYVISEGKYGALEQSIGYKSETPLCEIWFNEGDSIELETYYQSSNQAYLPRMHFSGILYELY